MNKMDAKGVEFVDECQSGGSFGVALRVVDEGNVHVIFRKVPMSAVAQLLRQAADICEKQADTERLN